MRLKSAYRAKLADNIPAETPHIPDEPIQPSESVKINFDTDKAEPVAAIEATADEATLTLQNQIAHLKKSEDLQREYALHMQAQRAAQMAAPEPTLPADPEARIALWRTQGLDEGDAAFLSEHLEMAERPDLTRLASDEAAEHHQRGTDDHRQLTKEIFDPSTLPSGKPHRRTPYSPRRPSSVPHARRQRRQIGATYTPHQ